jgi:TolB-like protein/tetratricopeptide (TPR) repeat protein
MVAKIPVDEQLTDQRRDASRLIAELRQWHVFRVAAGYGVAAWLVVQVVATVGPAFDFPPWILRAVVLAIIVGFLATMGFLLFRPKRSGAGRRLIYLSRRARLIAGGGVLVIALAAAALSIRSLRAPDQVSLAVLPFTDLSPAHDKAYFAEGVAEEIQSSLATENGIKVLGRTSASQIPRTADPHAVGASLGITHLLEGSTRTAGNDLRVNVRLISTKDGSELWDEEYRGALSDVFKVQDQIANSVVQRLRGTLFAKPVRTATPTAIDSYEEYLAARALIKQTTKASITRARQMAREIIDAHPDYAPGQALYADATSLLADAPNTYGDIPPQRARAIAYAHAKEAIRLAPDRADGYGALGLALPPQQAVKAYEKALSLDPGRVDLRGRLAITLNELKRNDEAFEQYRLSAQMDPLSQAIVNRYVQALAASGMVAEAMREVELFVRRSGMVAQGWRFRGNVYRYTGDESQHVAARRRALQLDPQLPYQHEWLARSLHLLGLNDQAAAYRPAISPYYQLFVSDDRGALHSRLVEDGSNAWARNGIEVAVFSLARERDWAALVRFYDVRPAEDRDICVTAPRFTPFLIMALRKQGHNGEAQRLLDCAQREITSELGQHYRSPDDMPGEVEIVQASLLALRNDRGSLDWLQRAVRRGWLGQYYSARLADWPQFDAFAADPRYAAIQKQIDASIARERAEVLASH